MTGSREVSPLTKKITRILKTDDQHWVGNGFLVKTLFAYPQGAEELSPFLLFDHAAPTQFAPTTERRGVGEHPHRGFETVTIVYEGEVEHRDSVNGGGKVGPGDVQWMTAASGVVHEEFHGREYAARGGPFEMVQLWVNLPAKDKMTTPRYQEIFSDKIPETSLLGGAGKVRVIAGEFQGLKGPALTYTPLNVLDLKLSKGCEVELPVKAGHNAIVVVLQGELSSTDGHELGPAHVALFERDGEVIRLQSRAETKALLLTGQPIEEPVVGQGPFVMNTRAEIQQAMRDYADGRMGRLS